MPQKGEEMLSPGMKIEGAPDKVLLEHGLRDGTVQTENLRQPPPALMKRAQAELAHTAIIAIGREEGPVKFGQSGNPNDSLRKARAEDWEARRLHAVRWVPSSMAAQVMEQLRLEQTVIGRSAGGSFFNMAGDEAALAIEQAATALKIEALDDSAFLEKCMTRIDGWRWG